MDIGRLGSLKSKLVDENLRNSVLKIERLSHKFEAILRQTASEGARADEELGTRVAEAKQSWPGRRRVAWPLGCGIQAFVET